MRIVCDSCGTKYSISDEKVRGKLFKFRCKNCSHVIVVRGNQSDEADADADAATDAAGAAGEEWFFVMDGQQAGPISAEDVAAYTASGDIQADTYMWREGMDDWLHVTDIPEFAHLVDQLADAEIPIAEGGNGHDAHSASIYAGTGEPDYSDDEEATRVMAAPDAKQEPAPTSLFSTGESTPPSTSESAGLARSFAGGGDLFGDTSSPARSSDAGGLFSGVSDGLGLSTAAEAEEGSGLVGQRNENSVLFSLDTLAGVESDDNGSDLPTTEGSGLIDIKALAASQAATGADFEATSISGDQQMVSAPAAVMPMGHRQSNKMLYAAIGAGAFVIIGLIVAIVVVLAGQDGGDDAVADNTTQGQQAQPGPTEQTPAEATPTTPTEDPGQQPPTNDQTAMATGPPQEHVLAANREGAVVAVNVTTDTQSAAESIANRPAPRRERDRSRDRDRDRDRERERERSRDDDNEREREREPERERERERDRSSDGDDPVSAALAQIGGGRDRDRDRTPREDDGRDDEPEQVEEDLPEELTTSQVSRTIRRYQRRLAECRRQSSLPAGEVLRVDVAMTVQGNGRVASARADSSDGASGCIEDVVRDMRFDEFSGEPMSFTYPFRIR